MSKVIVITGAGMGLGRTLARRFAADGDSVVLLGRGLAKVQAVADELGERALALACDVSSPQSVRVAFAAIAERHPKLDVLINNAALSQPFLVAEATDDQITKIVSTNLIGPMLCARAAIPLLGRGGHIINVSSESVALRFPHMTVYQASKAGLERFSEGLQQELESSGLKVTVVRAGQMFEEGKTWEVDAEARMRFAQAAMRAGINLRERPLSHYRSIASLFRGVIDLPEDVQLGTVTIHARHVAAPEPRPKQCC